KRPPRTIRSGPSFWSVSASLSLFNDCCSCRLRPGVSSRHSYRFRRHPTKTVNPRKPVLVERGIHDSTVPRRVIKPFFIDDDANVPQVAEENQRAKLVLFSLRRGGDRRPVRTRRTAQKLHADLLKGAPNK